MFQIIIGNAISSFKISSKKQTNVIKHIFKNMFYVMLLIKINSLRVFIEHTLRKIKIFRMMVERYRNRRKRFGLCYEYILERLLSIFNYARCLLYLFSNFTVKL